MEDNSNQKIASEVSVDVLFAAFDKFLKMAWKDQMGPVISAQTLATIEQKAGELYQHYKVKSPLTCYIAALSPGDFEDYVKTTFNEMAPQNRRSFRAIIRLLAELVFDNR